MTASDVPLNFDMWARATVSSERLLFWSALGSSVFVVLPFIANLWVAARIKCIVRPNDASSAWRF